MRVETKSVFSACVATRAAIFLLGLFALFVQLGTASDALNYTKNYFVTGDYVVGGVGLWQQGINGNPATGTINISGVPSGADIIAAFLYWETDETTAAPSAANGTFDGHAIVGDPRGNTMNPACGPGGIAPDQKGRVYRADVLRYLAVDTTNTVRLANGPHTVQLPDGGIGGGGKGIYPLTSGASLVIVYRVLTLGTPLRAVVIYDGAHSMTKAIGPMSQVVAGFYDSSSPSAKMTHIVANGQPGYSATVKVNNSVLTTAQFKGAQGARWDNPTFNFGLAGDVSFFETDVTASTSQVCLTWAAIVTSTQVKDSDGDGLLDVWESKGLHLNPGDATHPASFGTCAVVDSVPCLNLPAMGANPAVKDIFVEIDWEHGTDGHLHIPKLGALSMLASAFSSHGIQLHFDVGNNYQNPAKSYIVPAKYAEGGQVIEESTLLCPNTQTKVCAFPGLPYAVQGWKIGFEAIKNGFPQLNIPAYFSHDRKDTFHYVLFGHALATPSSVPGVPNSVSGVADRPGGDVLLTLGLWRNDDPVPCDPTSTCADQTGTVLVQAGTLMHELGHNLGLSHAGLYRAPNCEPNYPSVMNYLYQTRGLTDASGNSHVDFSFGLLPQLNESTLSENVFQHSSLQYRIRYYGPPSSLGIGTATLHCDGTPLNGDSAVRLESPIGPSIDWNNNGKVDPAAFGEDVDYNGLIGDPVQDSVMPTLPAGANGKLWLVDTNDWANLNLPQIGARMDVAGLSVDVAHADLGQADLGQADLGQADLGQADLGQADLGQADLGQADLGQADLGDVAYTTAISTLDATSASQPLAATTSLTGVALTWGAPTLGQIRQYNIYRSDPVNNVPVIIKSLHGTPPSPGYTDTVDQTSSFGPAPSGGSGTYYNTTYTYFVASVDINGTSSGPSNNVTGNVKHLFITANNQTRVYGDPNPALTFATAGMDPGETGTTLCSTTAVPSSNVGTYPITCTGLTPVAGVTYLPGTLTITQAPLTIAAVTNTKTYDATITAVAKPAVTGLKLSDTAIGLSETYDTKNAASGKTLSVATYTVNDRNGGNNYAITTPTNVTGVINKAPLTITAVADSKTYDATVTAAAIPTVAGLKGTDTISGVAETYGNANAGTAKTLTVSSSYSIADGNSGNNYIVTLVPKSSGTILKAPLTITAAPNTKIYDATTSAAAVPTTSGLQGSDGVTGLVETYGNKNVGTGLVLTVSSTYTVNDGNGGHNYTVTLVSNSTGVITQAPLTITAVPVTKTYDGTTSATGTPTTSGLQGSDTVTGLVEVFSSKNAGPETLSVSAYLIHDGNGGNNYSVTKVPNTTGLINKAPLTIAAVTNTKTYDAGVTAAALPAVMGLQTGDSVTGKAEVYASKNAGTGLTLNVSAYTVNDGNSGGNYTVTTPTISTGVINQKAASVTPNPASKTYGTVDPTFGGTPSGFIAGDGVMATFSRTAGENVAGSPYTISATLSPAAALLNYNIAYNTASFTINKANASVTSNPASKIYGAADPGFSGTLSGFIPTDSVTATYSRTAGETVAGSPYTISAQLSPAGVLGNYNITKNTASFTINKATASVTPNGNNKIYGTADPTLTGTLAGFVPADGVTATYVRVAGENVAGSPYTISAQLSPAGVLGNYTISYSTAIFTINKATASVGFANTTQTYTGGLLTPTVITSPTSLNASLTGAPQTVVGSYPFGATVMDSNYTGSGSGTFVIAAAPLTVSATGINKSFDGIVNATVTLSDNRVSAGDTFTTSYTSAAFSDPNVGTAKTVNVSGISISGPGSTNYALTSTSATTQADITDTIDLTGLVLNGSAAVQSGPLLRLTSDSNQTSSAWLGATVPVSSTFSTTFQFQISPVQSAESPIGDGFAFVIQLDSTSRTAALGTPGGQNLGYAGLLNSLAVEFDTFQNAPGDLATSHIGIQSNGPAANSPDHTSGANMGGPVASNFADGAPHIAKITYDGTTLSVFVDDMNTAVTTAAVPMSTRLALDGNTNAFVGFTAATGTERELSDILSWTWN